MVNKSMSLVATVACAQRKAQSGESLQRNKRRPNNEGVIYDQGKHIPLASRYRHRRLRILFEGYFADRSQVHVHSIHRRHWIATSSGRFSFASSTKSIPSSMIYPIFCSFPFLPLRLPSRAISNPVANEWFPFL